MSARSSAHSLLLVLAACGSKGPDADPAKVATLAKTMLDNIPFPAAVKECTDADFEGTHPLTERTTVKLSKQAIPPEPEYSDWANPSDVDYQSAFQLADDAADEKIKRKSAGEFLGAKGFVMYHVDIVDVPIAAGIRELKRGYAGYRAIRYDRAGKPTCVRVFTVKNSKKVAEWAQDQVEKAAMVDKTVQQAVQDDFRVQYKATIASLGMPRPAEMQ
jgi:hypothetical protein